VKEIFRPLYREGRHLRLLDQRLLPAREVWMTLEDSEQVARAIRDLAVRGAPAIGVAAAYGAAFGLRGADGPARQEDRFHAARELLASTRPTAVNLFAALERMGRRFAALAGRSASEIEAALLEEADEIAAEDIAACRRIGELGGALLLPGTVMTHCNAGALATAGYGTALGVVRGAVESGKAVRVLASETRPFLQGARLTAWELARDGIPVELITDGMGGHFLSRGTISAVVVGADRIASNGDTANKIGTYPLAVLARENGVPFYVAAPTTTVDLACPDGSAIPIEERSSEEVLSIAGQPIAPPGVSARYVAFDVTPSRYITAIITEGGVCRPPYLESLAKAVESASRSNL
jgi:methylthioribose-1-phosphate isomerase